MGWLSDAWDDVTDAVSDAWEDATDAVSDAWEDTTDFVGDTWNNVTDNFNDLLVNVLTGDLAGFINTTFGGSDSNLLGEISGLWNAVIPNELIGSIIEGGGPQDWWGGIQEDTSQLFAGKDSYADWGEVGESVGEISAAILPVVGAVLGAIYGGPAGAQLGWSGGAALGAGAGAAIGSAGGQVTRDVATDQTTDWGDVGINSAIAGAAAWAGGSLFGGTPSGTTEFSGGLGGGGEFAGGLGGGGEFAGGLGGGGTFAGGVGSGVGSGTLAIEGADDLLSRVKLDQWLDLASAAAGPLLYSVPEIAAAETPGSMIQGVATPKPSLPQKSGLSDPFSEQLSTPLEDVKGFNLGRLLAMEDSEFELPNLTMVPTGDDGLWQL